MRADMTTWKNMACFYGNALDLRDERILGLHQSKDLYELYYRNEQEKIRFLYIEIDAFKMFYRTLEQDGWESILITKYINLENKTPFFLLKCAKDGYSIRYHYEISKQILIDADILSKGEECSSLDKMSPDMRDTMKKLHKLVLGYTVTRFKDNVQLSDKLNRFIEQLNIPSDFLLESNTLENTQLIQESINQQFYHWVIELKKSQEYAINSVLSIYRKNFESAMSRTIVWLTLMKLVETYSEEKQESKEELINWLNSQYQFAKNELTKTEVEELTRHGIELL